MNFNKFTFIEMLDRIGAANSRIRLDYSFSIVKPGNYAYSAKQMAISALLHLIITECVKPYMSPVHGDPVEITKDRCLLQWEACVNGNGYTIEGVFYFEIVDSIQIFVEEDDCGKTQRYRRSNLYRAISLIINHYLNEDLQRKKEFRTQKEALYHLKKTYPSINLPDYVLETLFNSLVNDD
jgi:hypothetical protein